MKLVNAQHITKWWFLILFEQHTPAIRPRSEMVRRQSRRVKIWVALFNGPWLKSLIDNVAKLALFIKFYECSFHKIKTKLSKYCHMGLKMQATFA